MSVTIRPNARPRAADLWGLAFSAMGQQKVRTALTLIGVVVGTLALVLALSVGRGIDRAIVNLFHQDDRLRRIMVQPNYQIRSDDMPAELREPKGSMSDAKRKRLRKALEQHWNGVRRQKVTLGAVALRTIEAIEHVAAAAPIIHLYGVKAILDGKDVDCRASSVPPGTTFFGDRLIAGRMLRPDDGRAAIVHEYVLYRWGIVGDSDVESALGRTFRMEFRAGAPGTFDVASWISRLGSRELNGGEIRALESGLKKLAVLVRFLPIPAEERGALRELFERVSQTSTKQPQRTYVEEFTIVGVLREVQEKDREPALWGEYMLQGAEVLLPTRTATEFMLRIPQADEEGFESAVVIVDDEGAVKEVAHRIKELGFENYSLVAVIETVRMNVMLVSGATALVAVVALIVAAIGITNTMIMAVLERTHEIGILKALGARDGHIRLIFVVEGVLMGLVGSGIGLALGWLASFPGDSIARGIMRSQPQQPAGELLKDSLFVFPIWLVVGVPALVCLITTLAAWYPASRAARVDPVTSLRHD